MASPKENMETANNKAAEGGNPDGYRETEKNLQPELLEGDDYYVKLARDAISTGTRHIQSGYQARWNNAYRAFNNEHHTHSKYQTKRYKGRSNLFRPKTRAAVRSAMATAAAALFATADAVQVQPENDADEQQRASAKAKHELLNYRLDRQSGRSGLPWFHIAMGSRLDTMITGVCISKQYWEYKTKTKIKERPVIDELAGAPIYNELGEMEFEDTPEVMVLRDRPMVRLYPPDHVVRDPAANWLDQAQDSSFICLAHPMPRTELARFIRGSSHDSAMQFRQDIDLDSIRSDDNEIDRQGTEYAREGNTGADRWENNRNTGNKTFDTVWIYECFIRDEEEDWQFWYASNQLLSDPIPVEEAYPHMLGDRPLAVGIGSLESHKTDPLSSVTALFPLQVEANDVTNLRLDNIKQNMSPVTKVRRGRNVNVSQVQNRGPDSVIMLQDIDDVEWDRPPDVAGSAYAEMDRINADFDELAGTFSGGSVNTNRNLNETVGGMRMLQSGAASIAEFDLRVWIETWVEPVLRQLVRLEEWYETDERIMAIAGRKAQLFQKYGIDEFTDEMLASEVTVRVNAGIGSSDPLQRIERLGMAAQTLGGILGEELAPRAKQDQFIEEIMGALGYKDPVERFFNKAEEEDQRIQQMQQAIQELQKQLEDKQAEIASKEKVANINATADILEQVLENQAKAQEAEAARAHEAQMHPMKAVIDNAMQSYQTQQGHSNAVDMENRREAAAARTEQRQKANGQNQGVQ